MLIIGIDPGKTGGLFSLTEERQFHSAVPNLTPNSLMDWIQLHTGTPGQFYVEKAQAMPKQGVTSTFTYAQGFGELLGILMAFKQKFHLIPPQAWVKVMLEGVPHSYLGKERNVIAAKRLFPDFNFLASSRASTPHLGLVDSLLLAEYGRRLLASEHFLSSDNILLEP